MVKRRAEGESSVTGERKGQTGRRSRMGQKRKKEKSGLDKGKEEDRRLGGAMGSGERCE